MTDRDKRSGEGPEGLKLRRENRFFGAGNAAGKAEDWRSQLDEIREEFPDVDVEKALAEPELKVLLKAGVEFRTAFIAANIEEVIECIEVQAEKRAVDRVLRNSERAVENGVAASKSAPFSSGGGRLSKNDRDEIVRRVRRGEEIRL